MKKALAVAAAGALLALGAPAAHAGEITGGPHPQPTPIKTGGTSASICAFSGLDDLEESPSTPWTTRPRVTQNWGQESPEARAFLASIGAHPGQACKTKASEE